MSETDGTTDPTQPAAAPLMVGALLAAARTEQGLSVADVARQMKLSVHQVEALEADDYASLPGHIFVRGFVRNYAKLLQLDPQPLLDAAEQVFSAMPTLDKSPTVKTIPFPSGNVPGWRKYAIAAGTLVVLLLLYQGLREPAQPNVAVVAPPVTAPLEAVASGAASDVAAATSQAPAVAEVQQAAPPPPRGEAKTAVKPVAAIEVVKPLAAPAAEVKKSDPPLAAAAQPAAAEGERKVADKPSKPAAVEAPAKEAIRHASVRFVFEQDSWVEVKAADGKVIYSRRHVPAGTRQGVRVTVPFTVTIGNAAGVKVEYNYRSVDLTPYTSGNVARFTLE